MMKITIFSFTLISFKCIMTFTDTFTLKVWILKNFFFHFYFASVVLLSLLVFCSADSGYLAHLQYSIIPFSVPSHKVDDSCLYFRYTTIVKTLFNQWYIDKLFGKNFFHCTMRKLKKEPKVVNFGRWFCKNMLLLLRSSFSVKNMFFLA